MADLEKVRRILLSLRVTKEFLRQYPQLALKVGAALDKAERPTVPAR
jgi:hypothetical protein